MSPAARSRPLPRNEAELLQDRPADHQDGLLPSELLLPGERVLYAAHPSLRRSIGWGTGLVLILFLLDAVETVVAAIVGLAPGFVGASAAQQAAIAGALGLLLWGGILALLLRSRSRAVYALTNLRAISLRGLGGSEFRFLDLHRVVRVHLARSPHDTVVFEAATPNATGVAAPLAEVRWVGLRSAPRSLAFAHAAFAVEAKRVATNRRASRKEAEIREERIECRYCGNLVRAELAASGDLRCPRCAAPLPAETPSPSLSAPVAAAPVREGESEAIRHLRPAVHLAAQVLPWYRGLAVVWALCCGFVTLLLLAAPGGPVASLAAQITAAVMLAGLAIVGYVLWGQTLRKWGAVVRTLRHSLPPGSAWHDLATRSLTFRYRVAIAAFVASLVVPLAAWLTQVLLLTDGSGAGGAGVPGATTFAIALLSWGAALFAGQLLLVRSLPRVASGSGIASIDRELGRGSRTAALGLLATWALPLVVLDTFLEPFASPYLGLFALVGILGAVVLQSGLRQVGAGFERWSELASRIYYPTSGARGSMHGEAFATPTEESPAAPIGLVRSLGTGRRWVFAGAGVVAVVAVLATLSAVGALGPWLNEVASGGPPAAPPPPAPVVVAPAGTAWSIPVDHYWYDSFRTNHTGTLTGSFTANGTVDGYVMDSNDYNIWQVTGRVTHSEYTTGNVTQGAFHVPLSYDDRWYVVVINESPSAGVSVTWATECVATF